VPDIWRKLDVNTVLERFLGVLDDGFDRSHDLAAALLDLRNVDKIPDRWLQLLAPLVGLTWRRDQTHSWNRRAIQHALESHSYKGTQDRLGDSCRANNAAAYTVTDQASRLLVWGCQGQWGADDAHWTSADKWHDGAYELRVPLGVDAETLISDLAETLAGGEVWWFDLLIDAEAAHEDDCSVEFIREVPGYGENEDNSYSEIIEADFPGIEDCELWWETDPATLTLDGDSKATAWADQSANNRDLSQATAAIRPTFLTDQLNGYGALRFTATPTYMMLLSGLNLARNKAGWTAIYIYKSSSPTTDNQILVDGLTSFPSRRLHILAAHNSGYKSGIGYTRLDEVAGTLKTQNTYTPNEFGIHIGAWDWAAATASLWVNGTVLIDAAVYNTAGNTSDTDLASFTLGCGYTHATNRNFIGDLVAMIMYSRVLTADERTSINGHFSRKYGITLA